MKRILTLALISFFALTTNAQNDTLTLEKDTLASKLEYLDELIISCYECMESQYDLVVEVSKHISQDSILQKIEIETILRHFSAYHDESDGLTRAYRNGEYSDKEMEKGILEILTERAKLTDQAVSLLN